MKRKNQILSILYCFFLLTLIGCDNIKSPPFYGTIFIHSEIINDSDPSCFRDLNYLGQEIRTMFDRRVDDWIDNEAYCFPANYNDGLVIEVQVNSEFENQQLAKKFAEKYAFLIGKLPNELRKDVQTVWIHKGMKPFGGGNNNILIHTDWSEQNYEPQGIIEETLFHEACHTSLDLFHAKNSLWKNAQNLDSIFISEYARDNPIREDIAESYLPYFAIRYRRDRLPEELIKKIENAMPNRIKYFDSQSFKMYPISD